MTYNEYLNEAIQLLSKLIEIPSVSRSENKAADLLESVISSYGFQTKRYGNNILTEPTHYDTGRPTILLNAHIDTVKPVSSWSLNPFSPVIKEGKLYGLGANDCGGGLVSLLQTYRILSCREQHYNLLFLASAEEEVSGCNGISSVIPFLPHVDVAIVGEPTSMQPAVAEKGLMVLDIVSHGKSGHAAREEGVNAIYEALEDIEWIKTYKFDKVSEFLGPVKMQLTMMSSGTQHNVVPDKCEMVVDVRSNELYSNKEIYDIISHKLKSEVKARSFRLGSSRIDTSHPLVSKCLSMNMTPFGSPTLSDQALMPFPSLKIGPGNSSRSHSADEYIKITEIHDAINTYVSLLDNIKIT